MKEKMMKTKIRNNTCKNIIENLLVKKNKKKKNLSMMKTY